MAEKVVLAYSGGLDTSVIIPWLKETYGYDVIAFAADLGQGDDMKKLEKKAIKSGASKFYGFDLRKEFLTDFVWPTLKAGAVYENRYLLGTSFARPIIAKYQMHVAKKEGARAVAHGATGKGNDQVRFELTYFHFDPSIKIVAPWKDEKWKIRSREDAIDYANARGIPITATKKKIYSEDGNLWHLSHEGDELEDPAQEPLDRVFTISNPIEKAPSKAEHVTIGFVKGVPVSVNGKKLDPVALLQLLNKIGAKHGVGHVDLVENRLVGMKSRGVYETPGGAILYYAHDDLEHLVLDRDTYHYKEIVSKKYAELVYYGQWFTPLREAIDAFVNATQQPVTGTVRLKLYKGNIRSAGVTSPNSLYLTKMASFTDNKAFYNQMDAIGFIKLFGLPIATKARLAKKK
ncbi:MAG: argininosuccinate synthase [Candidatus Raymondbacteria bacterium RifOxyB12_full_50_8]|uniref:Argininosuccinate synthase n=1 Tax=Candidatus Raymondbacteria bacterium RIFOXYD12_FULL_49_13 TaxID=1817890 RepID=A0A1F7FI57_UNCRA|nr:MAG: argininosuccinate synthase [Candidatus Raymondbacteria bacterium RIFOXYA2_FULL_49_16]OGJ95698.1 MAG: argininosuccinate synthase [Candidatus Raymondbacteria bacterium RifOxyB12_full_50_8]OGK06298.1 MAG: argininosuccinate synthase [Candidatus Raymondbacteria bacterium RIFOXYD12_FULL_49_13]OGP40630.1 MAG: argininosuccinate synthase [Candidatus Raymondbacteria bacterium RIFOXYB2_FULL_49_35]